MINKDFFLALEDLEKETEQDLNINTCNNVPVWKAAMLLDKSEEFIFRYI